MFSSSRKPIDLLINCGYSKYTSTELHTDSTIDQLHQEVRSLCGGLLTGPYCLMFYHPERRKLVKFNENYLTNELNLFRTRSPSDNCERHSVELNVVDTSDEDEPGALLFCRDSAGEAVSHDDAPTVATITNSFPIGEQLETENFDPVGYEESTEANEVRTQAALSELLSFVSTEIRERTSPGPSSNEKSLHSLVLPVEIPLDLAPTKRIEEGLVIPLHPQPPYFSLDVKPEQKDIHKSDQFNQRDRTRTNGYITRVQGIKTPAQTRASVWPLVRIPLKFRNKEHVKLVVYVVSETIEPGRRLWYLHCDKAFLPQGFTRDSEAINPIEFEVSQKTLTLSGDLKLDLQMPTFWDKTTQAQLLCELEEKDVIQLHQAKHDPASPRLLCFLTIDNSLIQNTICLSDFIRKKASVKRQLTPNRSLDKTSPPVQTTATTCKRARAN